MKRIVVAGGGLAAVRTAEALRGSLGFDGAITVIGAERTGPYDRPPLSKQVLTGQQAPEDTGYWTEARQRELRVDLRLGQPATALDLARRTVRAGGVDVPFDGLVLATGAAARRPAVDGVPCAVPVLRTLDDARALRDALPGARRLVVIGAGFIGSEVAAAARGLGLEVTVIESAPVPLTRVVGQRIGEVCAALHRDNGTRLLCGVQVRAVERDSAGDPWPRRVRLADGRVVEGDLVVAGVGAVPATAWLAGSGLTVTDGVDCDAFLNTGHPAVYAAGDVARWHNPLFGLPMRTEQWTNATQQGRRAAANLLAGPGRGEPYAGSNYFWSDQYGVRIQFAGITDADELRVVHGSPADFAFLAYYRKGDRLVGAFAMGHPLALVRSKLLIERRAGWDEALALVKEGRITA